MLLFGKNEKISFQYIKKKKRKWNPWQIERDTPFFTSLTSSQVIHFDIITRWFRHGWRNMYVFFQQKSTLNMCCDMCGLMKEVCVCYSFKGHAWIASRKYFLLSIIYEFSLPRIYLHLKGYFFIVCLLRRMLLLIVLSENQVKTREGMLTFMVWWFSCSR